MATTKPNPYLIDDENPEWTTEDFKNARPAGEILHEIFSKEVADEMLAPKPGRKLGSGLKDAQNIRFDRDILATFKATGKGWQTRMNDALRTYLKEHPLKTA
ncbi:MAG: BrnA antitoxin family protein [Steroidobacteraceae bacterium]|nr:BrnA antitoxin family protein [Deltaproteobacteria bacterium]